MTTLRLATNNWAKKGKKSNFSFTPDNPYGRQRKKL